jgi:hypothetical protein
MGRRQPANATTMDALDQLKLITAWDIEPALTEGDLNAALGKAALKDAAGRAPFNEEWTATYDINAAASAAWLIKAARVAATVDEPTAGSVTSRVFENCCRMARIFAPRCGRTLSIR